MIRMSFILGLILLSPSVAVAAEAAGLDALFAASGAVFDLRDLLAFSWPAGLAPRPPASPQGLSVAGACAMLLSGITGGLAISRHRRRTI